MKISRIENMKGGWFVGDFEPTAHKTPDFEVSYKTHVKGEQWGVHYHEHITEVNLLTHGRMILQGVELKSGDIFVLEPYEIADPDFLEDCEIVCVKFPGIVGDKVNVKRID